MQDMQIGSTNGFGRCVKVHGLRNGDAEMMPDSEIKMTRKCTGCKKVKPLEEFRSHRSKPLGKSYRCFPCSREYERGRKRSYYTKDTGLKGVIQTRNRPISRYSMDGKFIKSYRGVLQAGKELNIEASALYRAVRNRSGYSHGYLWKYSDETTFSPEVSFCQCCGKVDEKDIFVKVSINCLRRLKGQNHYD